ncbi:MAG: endonuclease domain-containing protein [Bacteroidota bacterium]
MPVKNIIPGQPIARRKLERARELRRHMTAAERLIWQELRGNRLGTHFRRQQIIGGFIVDFYCHQAELVIELDGGIHQSREQREYDTQRDEVFREMGLRVLRLANEEVERDTGAVLNKIREAVRDTQ